MERKVLVICIDGFGPEYLECSPTPAIDFLIESGGMVTGSAVVPTVTNVNNVSIITGELPNRHGITSNYWIDRDTGKEVYMESPEFLCCETILERAKKRGLSTALLTSKRKLLGLLDAGAGYRLSAEQPDSYMLSMLGSAPDIYSPAINEWLFRALRLVLSVKKPDLTYCSTTDGAMHRYAPEDERSVEHISALDRILGIIVEENPGLEIYITADHGMSSKTRGIDLGKVLNKSGFEARCLPVIKDRYVVHHQNLGGAGYIFVDNPEDVSDAAGILKEVDGVELVCTKSEASEMFGLMTQRIGDLLVLGEKDVVFGNFDSVDEEVHVRSHGSLHERKVPIIGYPRLPAECKMNLDIVASMGL